MVLIPHRPLSNRSQAIPESGGPSASAKKALSCVHEHNVSEPMGKQFNGDLSSEADGFCKCKISELIHNKAKSEPTAKQLNGHAGQPPGGWIGKSTHNEPFAMHHSKQMNGNVQTEQSFKDFWAS